MGNSLDGGMIILYEDWADGGRQWVVLWLMNKESVEGVGASHSDPSAPCLRRWVCHVGGRSWEKELAWRIATGLVKMEPPSQPKPFPVLEMFHRIKNHVSFCRCCICNFEEVQTWQIRGGSNNLFGEKDNTVFRNKNKLKHCTNAPLKWLKAFSKMSRRRLERRRTMRKLHQLLFKSSISIVSLERWDIVQQKPLLVGMFLVPFTRASVNVHTLSAA